MIPRRIGFVLLSNPARPQPSTRIAALNMFPALRQAGWEPVICHAPEHGTETPELALDAAQLRAQGIECVVFQKVYGPSAERLASRLRAVGIATIFLVCDVVEAAMAEATDITVTVTQQLRSLYPAHLQPRIHVVHDGIEQLDRHRGPARDFQPSVQQPLRAIIVTSAAPARLPALPRLPAWLRVRIVGAYARELLAPRWSMLCDLRNAPTAHAALQQLQFAFDRSLVCTPWGSDAVYAGLLAADIGLIPVDTSGPADPPQFPLPMWRMKSENRLTLMMSAGLPVVATPVPSYIDVIENGSNGFLAHTAADWTAALEALRSPARRDQIGQRARARVNEHFSQQRQATLLLEAIAAALTAHRNAPRSAACASRP